MTNNKVIIGYLMLTLLAGGVVYIQLENTARMRIDNDKTTFYVPHETYPWMWTVAGREYNSLFAGTTKVYRDAKNIKVVTEYDEVSKEVKITRVTPYKNGAVIVDTYEFDGDLKSVELFPISHTVEVYNATGLFYQYDVKDLSYDGATYKLDGVQTSAEFGKNMKVEWWSGYRLGWVYKTGTMYVKSEKIKSDYERFEVRLFDPIYLNSIQIDLFLDGINQTRKYEFQTSANLSVESNCSDYHGLQNRTMEENLAGVQGALSQYTRYFIYPGPDEDAPQAITWHLDDFSDMGSEIVCYDLSSNLKSCTLADRDTCFGTLTEIETGFNCSFQLATNLTVVNLSYSHFEVPENAQFSYNNVNRTMPEAIKSVISNWSDVSITYCSQGGGWKSYQDGRPVNDLLWINPDDVCYIDLFSDTNFSLYDYADSECDQASSCFYIYDNTSRYLNYSCSSGNHSMLYLIDILRINYFNDTKTSKTDYDFYIDIDNRTDLKALSFNISSNATDSLLYFSNTSVSFPGTFNGALLETDTFIFGGNDYKKLNITFTTAETKNIYFNTSSFGADTGFLNFTISAFDLDVNNEFYYNVSWNESDWIEYKNSTYPFILEEFKDNRSWNESWDKSNCAECSYNNLVSYSGGQYYYVGVEQSNTPGSSKSGYVFYDNTVGDLRDIQYFIMNYTSYMGVSHQACSNQPWFSGSVISYITDGVSDVVIKSHSGSFTQSQSSTQINRFELYRVADRTFKLYNKGVFDSNIDISSLNVNNEWQLKYKVSASCSDDGPCVKASLHSRIYLYNIYLGGFGMNKSSGVYDYSNKTIISKVIEKTTDDIATAILTASDYQPSGSNIVYYLSNDNTTWEAVSNGETHVFASSGKNLSWKAELTYDGSNNLTSPLIRNVKVDIIPSTMSGVEIALGYADAIVIDYELNSTSTPIYYSGDNNGTIAYIDTNCKYYEGKTDCLIPIALTSYSGGILEISAFNHSRNVNPINLSYWLADFENDNQIFFNFSNATDVNGLKLDYYGNRNISVDIKNLSGNVLDTKIIQVKYSKFNLTVPSGQTYWEIFPSKRVQNNIQPFGQTATVGFWNVTSLAYDTNIDVYVKYNESIDTCVTDMRFIGENFSNSATFNVSLNTTSKILYANQSATNYGNLFTYTDISCASTNKSFIIPYFCFHSLCTDCVKTVDWDDNCDYVE